MQPDSAPAAGPTEAVDPRKSAIAPAYPSIRAKLVRGVRLLPIKRGRPKPYGVMWSIKGKRQAEYFETLEKLEAKVVTLCVARRGGVITDVPTRQELHEWREFKVQAGNVSPLEILMGWRQWRENKGSPVCDTLVSTAVKDRLDRQEKRKDRKLISPDTYRQRKRKLTLFSDAFGTYRLDQVTAELIENWIDGLDHVESETTFNDYVKRVRELYGEYSTMIPNPPTEGIIYREDMSDTVRVMSVDDANKLLQFTVRCRPSCIVRLALEMFLGLRTSTAGRVTKENISLANRTVTITKRQIKTKSSHIVTPPAALWPWIREGWDNPRGWSMTEAEWMHAKSKLFIDAEVPHPRNVLRHTFASYHLATNQDPGLTAWLMMHRNQQMLWSTYRGQAAPAAGKRYFKLRPNS